MTQLENEHLLMKLTVEESLIFASKLKNISNVKQTFHKNNAEKLLDKLGLRMRRDVSLHNCSGGQRKSLAIAGKYFSGNSDYFPDSYSSGTLN